MSRRSLGFKFSVEFYGIKEAGIKGDELNVAFVALDLPSRLLQMKSDSAVCRSWIGLPPAGNENATGPG